MMKIQSQEIQVKEFNGQRVVTFKDIDFVHQRNPGTAKWNFNHNKQHFVEGEDFLPITRKEFGVKFTPNEKIVGNPNLTMLLITESGYLMLVKSFTDDLAWAVQSSEQPKKYMSHAVIVVLNLKKKFRKAVKGMYKEYVVTFLNLDTNKVGCDCFMGKSEGEANHAFHECYRHHRYKILSTVETGRD